MSYLLYLRIVKTGKNGWRQGRGIIPTQVYHVKQFGKVAL
jgi:hypothetical protein